MSYVTRSTPMQPLPADQRMDDFEVVDFEGKHLGTVQVLEGSCGINTDLKRRGDVFVAEWTHEAWEPKTEKDFLHLLRNPYGHTEQNIRAARLWAADRIEKAQEPRP